MYDGDGVPELEFLRDRYSRVFDAGEYQAASASRFITVLREIRKQADIVKSKDPKDYFGDLGLQGFFYKILNAMGAEYFDFGEVYNYNLAALSSAISDYESVWIRLRASEVKGFFYFVYAYARSHYTEKRHSSTTLINAVHVITIHKAKGLEFPVVFIPNFEKKTEEGGRAHLLILIFMISECMRAMKRTKGGCTILL